MSLPLPAASALWVKAACSDIRTAWLRFGLPSSAPEPLRARVSSTCASLSDIRSASTFAVSATLVSLSPPCCPDEAAMLVRASRPVALRAGSAAPRRTLSEVRAAVTTPAQEYVFFGQPSRCDADGTIARPTGEEATESEGEMGMPVPSPSARSSQRSESGSQTWKSGASPPPASASATL